MRIRARSQGTDAGEDPPRGGQGLPPPGLSRGGVDKVMEEAGLTAGGFYAHFESKEALWPRPWGPPRPRLGPAVTRISRQWRAAYGSRHSSNAT